MSQDVGIINSIGKTIPKPLPKSWLGRVDAPTLPPSWASISVLTNLQIRALQSQISYDLSNWDHTLISSQDRVGRYQFSASTLEQYNLIKPGSTAAYGTQAVYYKNPWAPVFVYSNTNIYENYLYNISSLTDFLSNPVAQDHLAYQIISDLYTSASNINVIRDNDSADIIAGMLYVTWTLGAGSPITPSLPSGSGAWAWRYYDVGFGADSFNSGRYAIQVLSS